MGNTQEIKEVTSTKGVDEKKLYGEYLKSNKWKQDLYKKAAHKSLDIADDDMPITTTTTNSLIGLGWKELTVISSSVLGGLYLLGDEPEIPLKPTVQEVSIDSSYDVFFYDKDGNKIEVPRIPANIKQIPKESEL